MTSTGMSIADFLLARIAEDAEGDWHSARCGWSQWELQNPCDCGVPARVLAECEAKRKIVRIHGPDFPNREAEIEALDRGESISDPCDQWPACETLRILATPYSDHPDFDPAWLS